MRSGVRGVVCEEWCARSEEWCVKSDVRGVVYEEWCVRSGV